MTKLEILKIITLGITLSLDAFTLSLAYGLLKVEKKESILTSLTVGIFHLIMPLIGNKIGFIINEYIKINSKIVLILVLSLILIETIKSIKEETKEYDLTLINTIVFSFLVSLDSFTLGLGLNCITNKILLSGVIFMLLSGTFTYIGFALGKYINKKAKIYSKITSIIILITFIVYLICKP